MNETKEDFLHIWVLQRITLYHKALENHIFRHNSIFRHTCLYRQPTLITQWNYNIFVQIWYSYFRNIGRLVLVCALFVARCDIIRASWEAKKERLSYRKKYIEEFAWGTYFFGCTSSFLCHFLLLSSSTLSPFIMLR